jgi:hypothetical protein
MRGFLSVDPELRHFPCQSPRNASISPRGRVLYRTTIAAETGNAMNGIRTYTGVTAVAGVTDAPSVKHASDPRKSPMTVDACSAGHPRVAVDGRQT